MSGSPTRIFEFATFRLAPEEALLVCGDEPIALSPKTLKLLCILVENAGHLIEKDELMRALWPDTHVAENNLTYNISVLRKALGESEGGNGFIATVAKRGYRFVVPVRVITADANGSGHSVAKPQPEQADRTFQHPFVNGRPKAKWRQYVFVPAVTAILVVLVGAALWLRHGIDVRAASRAPEHSKWSRNSEANQWLQRGQFILDRRVPDSGRKGLDAVQQALVRDPNFALAQATAAVAYVMNGDFALAEQAARRSLDLDPQLPEAHNAMGFVAMFCEWDWPHAEQEFKRAIELDTNYSRAHHWYGIWLQLQGRLPEAEREIRRALELEPNFPALSRDLAELLYYERRYDEAVQQANRTMDLDPAMNEHGLLADIYTQTNAPDAALREALLSIGVANPESLKDFQEAAAHGGLPAVWRLELSSGHYVRNGFFQAHDYALLGRKQDALRALATGYRAHEFFMPFMAVDPALDGLRNDAEFLLLLKRIGLPTRPEAIDHKKQAAM